MHGNANYFLWIVVIAAGLLSACSSSEKRPPEMPPRVAGVQTEVVQLAPARLVYQAAGTVRASNTAMLAAQLAGTVREIRVKAGDHVRRGQLLAVLDDRAAAFGSGARRPVSGRGEPPNYPEPLRIGPRDHHRSVGG